MSHRSCICILTSAVWRTTVTPPLLVLYAESVFAAACETCNKLGLSAEVGAARRTVDKRKASAQEGLKQAVAAAKSAELICQAIDTARWVRCGERMTGDGNHRLFVVRVLQPIYVQRCVLNGQPTVMAAVECPAILAKPTKL